MTLPHEKYVAAQTKLNGVPIEFELATTALVIIDMQEYFLNPQSPFSRYLEYRAPGLGGYFRERSKMLVEPNLRRLLEFFRAQELRVIFTTVASEYQDGSDWTPAFRSGNVEAQRRIGEKVYPARTDPWARVVETLEPMAEEAVINKTTFGAFASTGLDATLRSLGIGTLVLGGVLTNRCVETTMREATDRGYRVVLVDDGTATYSPELQDATTLSLQGAYGFVRMAGEVLDLLEQGRTNMATEQEGS